MSYANESGTAEARLSSLDEGDGGFFCCAGPPVPDAYHNEGA